MILLSDPLELVPGEYVSEVDSSGSPISCLSLVVPEHIWHALGLRGGMPCHLDLYENRQRILENEIVCSSLEPRLWPHLWRLKIAFHDRNGLLADLTDILEEMNIDVLACRAETVEPDGLVNFELLLNAENYTSANPEWVSRRESLTGEMLPLVRGQILQKFIRHIEFYGDEPLFSLRRIPQLVMAHRRIQRARTTDPQALPLGQNSIPVPIHYLHRIRDAISKEFPDVTGPETARIALRADTEASVLRLMILFPHTRHLSLSIKHKDLPGALAAISMYMKQHDLNLLQLWTERVGVPASAAITRVILSVPKNSPHFGGEQYPAKIQQSMERKLDVVYNCDLGWPGR